MKQYKNDAKIYKGHANRGANQIGDEETAEGKNEFISLSLITKVKPQLILFQFHKEHLQKNLVSNHAPIYVKDSLG